MELRSLGEEEERPLAGDLLQDEHQSFLKKHKMYIIICAIVLLIILIIVLLAVFLKESDNSKKDGQEEEKDDNYKAIKLEVFSDTDDKEILFLSEEFNLTQLKIRNLEENKNIKVDGKEYPFTKSMNLKKGKHTIELYLKNSLNNCKNMFKNCKDIISIYFEDNYDCNKNMDFMFSGCVSLVNLNIDKINTSYATTMENIFNECNSIEEINLKNFNTSLVTNMKEMFNNCKKLKNIFINNFETYFVENMFHIF